MDIKDFWDMVEYVNVSGRGKFSNRELCEYAFDYYMEYLDAKTVGIQTGSALDSLIEILVDDWENLNLGEKEEHLIGDWLENIAYDTIGGSDPFDNLLRAYRQ